MKQIYIVMIVILMTLTANAGWKPLKSLEYYGSKAFILKKNVIWVEIRKYTKGREGSHTYKSVDTVLRIYRRPLSAYGPKVKRAFKDISVKKCYAFKRGTWVGVDTEGSWYHNGFMLDDKQKSWRLENARDVIDMLRPIDTSAEIKLVLWLNSDSRENDEKYSAKYRKSGSGYVVQEHYIRYGDISSCGDFTYQYKISRDGKITQKKLIKKRKVECGGD